MGARSIRSEESTFPWTDALWVDSTVLFSLLKLDVAQQLLARLQRDLHD